MFAPKKLIKVPRKLQKITSTRMKRSANLRSNEQTYLNNGDEFFVTDRGHFVIYTIDWKRFSVPLSCLGNKIFQELFRMSEEEFGISSDGPIVLPCDSVFMDYIVSLIQHGMTKQLQQLLVSSIATRSCTFSACKDYREDQKSFVCRN